MTSSGPAPRRAPLLNLTGLEWKLTLTAVLSAIYALSFIAVSRPPAPTEAVTAAAPATTVTLASNTQPALVTSAPARPAAAPVAAQPRVRTRSS
jgi:hypothetical protein